MKRLYCLIFLLISLFSISFYIQLSPKKILNNYKFTLIHDRPGLVNYFVIRDSIHQEYVNGKLFMISRIDWLPDSTYKATVRWLTIDVKSDKLIPGDSMNMKVLSFIKDTISLEVSVRGNNIGIARFLRSPLED